jgi:CO/xanthine dehydrogenase FAD-binding subunit
MLINLQTIHRPETIEEAAGLLKRSGVYPVYGGGAYLIRAGNPDVQGAVDLARTVNAHYGIIAGTPWIGGCATLETITASDAQIGAIVRAEAAWTLRNTLTLGDVLMECQPDSLLLALLCGLEAQVICPDDAPITIEEWIGMSLEEWSTRVILRVELPDYVPRRVAVALEKVSRTPADRPIVAAIGFSNLAHPAPYALVVGVANRPVRYIPGLQSRLSDYRGSAEYRTEMAKLLAGRAIAAAQARLTSH